MLPSNYYLLLCPKRFHFSKWNVAGVLWSATLHRRCRFYRWGKKIGGRHHRHWMNPVIQKEQFLSCRLANSRAQTEPSLRWAQSGGISVGISFILTPKENLCSSASFWLFFVCLFVSLPAVCPTGDEQISCRFCWWFWVHRDSFLFTVSNLMAHVPRGNKNMLLIARCSWSHCTVCMKFREAVVVHLNVPGRHWAI